MTLISHTTIDREQLLKIRDTKMLIVHQNRIMDNGYVENVA